MQLEFILGVAQWPRPQPNPLKYWCPAIGVFQTGPWFEPKNRNNWPWPNGPRNDPKTAPQTAGIAAFDMSDKAVD